MSEINKSEAPQGYVAVEPEQYSDQSGGCEGCCFDSEDDIRCMLDVQHYYTPTPCWAEGREDERDVIFKPVLN